MLPVKSSNINGHTYQCTLFPAKTGYLRGMKISKICSALLTGSDAYSIIAVLETIIETDKDGSFVLDLFSSTLRDGAVMNENVFNEVYAGNYSEMFDALKFIVESNYGDVWELIKKKMGSLEEKKEETGTDEEVAKSQVV